MTVRGAKFEFFDELMRRRFVLLLLGRGRGGEGGERGQECLETTER